MGWWGVDIMDGDSPLGWEGDIADTCEIEQVDGSYGFTAEVLNKKQREIKQSIEKGHWDIPIAYQVWGRLILAFGAEMPTEVRNLVLGGIDEDALGQDYPERKVRLEAFRNRVLTYNGQPQKFYDLGLLGTLQLKTMGANTEAFKGGVCPVCDGTIEETETEYLCQGACGHAFPKQGIRH